ncbi:Rib/alpha-like domain-containing protein [uncultured Lactobacillus sp.]|uniref:Rib/alpha-like domain-containing protein n=1 Tax=uncultured Lactobacillus sp. TaxID=153152 RepID=UPI0025D8CB8D|nr:Rib/alpha-like domain-containing protein [uncultured Lactobacillus sp.]
MALLGAAVPAVEGTPTAMAAKKTTKKAKKSTKKAAKKTTKKAKKSTKKSVKKSTKKAKKAKKSTKKKSTKKVAKKTSKKKATKKPVKKVAKKKVVKKTAKKAAPKKTTSKKTAKKVVKKATTKKPVKKVVKKTTTKKPAQKVIKRLTMADKYQPKVKSGTVKVDWGADLTSYLEGYRPEDFITNKSSLPSDVGYDYLDKVDTKKGGTYTTRIQATYSDGSKEVVGSVTFVVPTTDVDKYQPTVHDVALEYGADYSIRKDFITNPAGYFPNDPIFSQFEWTSDRTQFDLQTDSENSFSVREPGTYTVHVKVTYPDESYEDTNKFKITVLPSQAETIKVAPKASSFTVSSSSALEYRDYDLLENTLVDPSFFLTNASALPKGTVVYFNGSLDSTDTLDPGKYESYLTIKFPDGSSYDTDNFIVNVK